MPTDFRPARRRHRLRVGIVAAGLILSMPCLAAVPDSEALTNVVQVRSLSADEAQRQLPVVIHGAVTYLTAQPTSCLCRTILGVLVCRATIWPRQACARASLSRCAVEPALTGRYP